MSNTERNDDEHEQNETENQSKSEHQHQPQTSFSIDGRRTAIDWTDIVHNLSSGQVTHVHFSHVRCGSDEIEIIDNSLTKNTVHSLKLESIGLGSSGTNEVDALLPLLFNQRKTLRELSLMKNSLSGTNLRTLSEWMVYVVELGDLVQLQSVNLAGNRITDHNFDALCKSLSEIQSLTQLLLHSNQISDGGCDHLSDLISLCTQLRELDLWNNQINATGVAHLCRTLNSNAQLVCIIPNCVASCVNWGRFPISVESQF